MNYFKIDIYGDSWGFYLIPDDDNVIADETAAAETDIDKREIYFRKSELEYTVVLHELWHVLFHYSFTGSAGLDSDQLEEISAELFAHKSEKMIEIGRQVYENLVKLRDEQGEEVES